MIIIVLCLIKDINYFYITIYSNKFVYLKQRTIDKIRNEYELKHGKVQIDMKDGQNK